MAPSWNFPPFRLDLGTGSLWREDELVPLPPKPFAVLATLVAQAGQVVTKEALFAAAWPDTAVTDGVLKGCIRQIRRALGERAGAASSIATVHRRGYRFRAPVTPVAGPGSGAVRRISPCWRRWGNWGGVRTALTVTLVRQSAPTWLVHLPALVPAADYEAVQRRAGGATRERMLRELAEAVEALTAQHPLVLSHPQGATP